MDRSLPFNSWQDWRQYVSPKKITAEYRADLKPGPDQSLGWEPRTSIGELRE
jgi:hypothetical protein